MKRVGLRTSINDFYEVINPVKITVGLITAACALAAGLILAIAYLLIKGGGDYNLSAYFLALGTLSPILGGFVAGRGILTNWHNGFLVGLFLGLAFLWLLSVIAPRLLTIAEMLIVVGYCGLLSTIGAIAAGRLDPGYLSNKKTGEGKELGDNS